MVRRIPIGAKVAGALAVPLLGLGIAGGVGVAASAGQARAVTDQAELATASVGHAGVVDALQLERDLSGFVLLGLDDAIDLELDDVDVARQRTDAASTALRHEIADQAPGVRDGYANALSGLADLAGARERVDAALAGPGPHVNREVAHEVFAAYTTIVAAFLASHESVWPAVAEPELHRGGDLLHHAARSRDAVAQLAEMVIYVGSGPGGVDQPAEVAEIAARQRDVERSYAQVQATATGAYAAPGRRLFDDPRLPGMSEMVSGVVAEGEPVDARALLRTTPLGPEGGYPALRDGVVEQVDAQAAVLSGDAEARLRWLLAGTVGLVAVALLVAWTVTRSITRPLQVLSIGARQIATYRLPNAVQDILDAPSGEDLVVAEVEPISVRARDEVADVAGAFNDVQGAAIGLAVEQAALRRNVAESYVNLGRRNQNLLNRLRDGLGDLAASEPDPCRRGQLRKLDHLATRIRRHAESLLVLSNAESAGGWHPPAAIGDVVNAALAEVEHHERVLVRRLDGAHVLGGAAADVAHLLAELIENGLRHSPPRELVEVSGRASAGTYTISIVDHGLGMTPEDIELANQRLAGTESFTVTPAKYLGHYVTAVLAARHGIDVRLQGSVVVGIAVDVDLPAALLVAPTRGDGGDDGDDDVPVSAPPLLTGLAAGASAPGATTARAAGARAATPGGPRPIGPTSPGAPLALPGATPAVARSTGEGLALGTSAVPGPGLVELARPATRDNAGGETGRGGEPAEVLKGTVVPAPNGAGAEPDERDADDRPARTASGLVRRVRGAHIPVATAARSTGGAPAADGPPGSSGAPAQPSAVPADRARDAHVAAPAIQQFLTDLVGGVQRSLDEQTPASGAEDEE